MSGPLNHSPDTGHKAAPARIVSPNDGCYKSLAELHALQLDGLPKSQRGLYYLAQREGWHSATRGGRGGGLVYSIRSLPQTARDSLTRALWDRIHSGARGASAAPMGRPLGSIFDHRPEFAQAVEAILSERKLAATRVHELLVAEFEKTHDKLPSLRNLQRFISRLEAEKPALFSAGRNPDEYKNIYKVALGRSDADCTYAHEAWELDTTKADVITIGGRMMILGIIDRWSRRARFLVVPSESAQSVRALLVDTIRAWGVMPTRVITDNGSGFINASVKSALETLGIGQQICLPGTPEDKPHIERVFGTFTRARAEILAGYSGHNVADAQALRARAKAKTGRALVLPQITNDQLQQILDNWVDGTYHLNKHRSLGMSPMQKWQSSTVLPAAAPDEGVLRLAMSAYVGIRKVGKRGVGWQGGRYWSAACAAYMGREIMVRRDERELGELFLFTLDGEYIDTASDPARLGISQAVAARMATEHQNAFMKSAKAELREKQRKYDFGRMRDQLLRDEAERAGKLTHLPPITQERATLAMQSMAGNAAPHPGNMGAGAARRASKQPASKSPPLFAPNANNAPASADQIAAKIARADRILHTLNLGGDGAAAIPETDRIFAQAYSASSEYRAAKVLQAHFQPRPHAPAPENSETTDLNSKRNAS